MKRLKLGAAAIACCLLTGLASAANWLNIAEKTVQGFGDRTTSVQHQGVIEVGFSPREGAEKLVLKAINSARSEIRVMSYSFTSARVTEALLSARHRGVDVALVADHKNNLIDDKSGKPRAAFSALVNAGCRVRTISAYPISHDKTVVVDRETVETGSFNFSDAAANRNSENVIVIWKNPDLAKTYLSHWQDRFDRGQDYRPNY